MKVVPVLTIIMYTFGFSYLNRSLLKQETAVAWNCYISNFTVIAMRFYTANVIEKKNNN